jgi:hypothetical protein
MEKKEKAYTTQEDIFLSNQTTKPQNWQFNTFTNVTINLLLTHNKCFPNKVPFYI